MNLSFIPLSPAQEGPKWQVRCLLRFLDTFSYTELTSVEGFMLTRKKTAPQILQSLLSQASPFQERQIPDLKKKKKFPDNKQNTVLGSKQKVILV